MLSTQRYMYNRSASAIWKYNQHTATFTSFCFPIRPVSSLSSLPLPAHGLLAPLAQRARFHTHHTQYERSNRKMWMIGGVGALFAFGIYTTNSRSNVLHADAPRGFPKAEDVLATIPPIVGKDVEDAPFWRRIVSCSLDQVLLTLLPKLVSFAVHSFSLLSLPLQPPDRQLITS